MSDAKLVREDYEKRGANRVERALGLKKEVEKKPPAKADVPQPVGVSQPVVQQLVRWIPTESITLYVAIIALLTYPKAPPGEKLCAQSFTAQWWWTGIFAAFSVFAVFAIFLAKVRTSNQPFRWPFFEMAVAPVAFCAWAAGLPATPLGSVCGYKTEYGAVIILFVAIFIGLVAGMLGKNPPSS
jgi:hypothetical protein